MDNQKCIMKGDRDLYSALVEIDVPAKPLYPIDPMDIDGTFPMYAPLWVRDAATLYDTAEFYSLSKAEFVVKMRP